MYFFKQQYFCAFPVKRECEITSLHLCQYLLVPASMILEPYDLMKLFRKPLLAKIILHRIISVV